MLNSLIRLSHDQQLGKRVEYNETTKSLIIQQHFKPLVKLNLVSSQQSPNLEASVRMRKHQANDNKIIRQTFKSILWLSLWSNEQLHILESNIEIYETKIKFQFFDLTLSVVEHQNSKLNTPSRPLYYSQNLNMLITFAVNLACYKEDFNVLHCNFNGNSQPLLCTLSERTFRWKWRTSILDL